MDEIIKVLKEMYNKVLKEGLVVSALEHVKGLVLNPKEEEEEGGKEEEVKEGEEKEEGLKERKEKRIEEKVEGE